MVAPCLPLLILKITRSVRAGYLIVRTEKIRIQDKEIITSRLQMLMLMVKMKLSSAQWLLMMTAQECILPVLDTVTRFT